ncbi:MAG TPA: hypothetical protein H9895_11235 [Candidatus Pseudogracilibacillus intestinigallinarum]|uniref:Spore cortex biosynthesis protein YabQ n=1 Tax=Candidatus Pseudogracilibacillus intestinigallinarum TaxID=2838742 RepID=A0A9D1PPL9_9BACI|nr:hypothetical protein [Candidatus Pseudogracilibacillus intestinigallinarum]
MTVHQEWVFLGVMICTGVYIGISTDTFRHTIMPLLRNALLYRFLFVLYWLCQTAIVYYILYKMNNGILRFYFLLAVLLGYSAYIVFVQTFYMKCLQCMMHIVRFIWRAIYILVVKPITYILYFCMRCLLYVYNFLKKCMYKVWFKLFGQRLQRLKRFILRKNSNIITILCRFYSTIYTKLIVKWKR